MADNRIKQNIYSGIKVTDNISFTIPKKTFIPDFIPIILIAFCGSAGIIYSFITMFQIEISREFINIYIAMIFTLFCVIFILPKKFMLSLIPIFIIYETLLYKNWNTYVKGFMLIYNQVYNIIWPRRSEYFRIELSEINIEKAKSVFMGFSLFIIIMIICYVTIVKPNFFFGFLITFPFIEIGLYYGKSPSLFPAFMIIIYWTVLLSIQQSGYYRNIGRSKAGFIRKGNSFIVKPLFKYRTAGQSGILLMLGSFLIIGLTFLIFNKTGYSRSEKINTVRDNLKSAFNEFTFEDVKGSIERISESFELGNVKVYNHRLGNQYSVSFNNKTDLIVTCDEAFMPDGNIYLKGYVGSIYDGKSWNEHNNMIYNNKELFNNSRSRPQDFLYNSISRLNESSDKNYNLNIEACFRNARYNYTPYNSLPNGEVNYINDTIIDLADKKNYSFKISENQNFNRFLKQNNFSDSMLEGYEEFVYENYLEVPNNNEINQLYNEFIKDDVSVDIYNQLNNIKKILSENAEYTLEPGKTPSGRDFVNYFLTENHKGYCVHFATSGVILARMSGIPARYAEGYVLTEDDFNDENLTLNGYKIEIKDNRAHAWAEVYLKDFGWIPFEFTPSSAAAFTNTQSPDTMNITTTHPEITKVKENTSVSNDIKNTENNINTTVKLTHIQDNTQITNSSERLSNNYRLTIEKLLIITVIIILILTIFIIVLIHLFIAKKRRKSFNTKNYSDNSLNAYQYILKILDFCGIKNDTNMQYIEFAQYAEQNSKGIFKSNEFIEATKIALEAKLSSKNISKTKSETVIALAYKISDKIYRKQNFFIRLYMKYLKNLC